MHTYFFAAFFLAAGFFAAFFAGFFAAFFVAFAIVVNSRVVIPPSWWGLLEPGPMNHAHTGSNRADNSALATTIVSVKFLVKGNLNLLWKIPSATRCRPAHKMWAARHDMWRHKI